MASGDMATPILRDQVRPVGFAGRHARRVAARDAAAVGTYQALPALDRMAALAGSIRGSFAALAHRPVSTPLLGGGRGGRGTAARPEGEQQAEDAHARGA